MSLQAIGDELWKRVGREPSGNPFNSPVQLESEHGKPRNPFINAGAIVVADVLLGVGRTSADLVAMLSDLCARRSTSTKKWRRRRPTWAFATARWRTS
jgi:glutaminase